MIRSVAADGRPNLGGVFRPVDRPRVLERIATAAQYRIATIIAPAGFGKTVAVRQFLSTVSSSVVYDVATDATTLVPFVRGFADALAEIVPTMRRSLGTALDGARASTTPGRDLAAWAATHLRSLDTLIAIDDLHIGEGDAEVSRFITALVDRTKDGPRWLFSSRSPLQLPVASWLAYGESDLVIDTVDLRFSLDEAKQNARAARLTVRDEELQSILDLVDGWPAALSFALRTSTRASDLRAVSAGTREMVYRYLAEQVWHSLDDRVREFLQIAAFLPPLETRLAVAAGYDDATALIESLRERVAFITVLEPGVYKLHDLFREFVQRQVALQGDEAFRDTRVRAANVLEGLGQDGAALERYVAAGAPVDIERVFEKTSFALLEDGHFDTVEAALRALPAARATSKPQVLAMRAAVEEAYGRIDQAERWYLAAMERADSLDLLVTVTARYGVFMQQRSRLSALSALEGLRARDDLSSRQRAHVCGILGGTYAVAGRSDDAKAAIEEALNIADYADDELRARTYSRAAIVAFYAAEEETVERYGREGTRLAVECGAFGLAARICGALTSMHTQAGRLPVAAWYAGQIVAHSERAGDPQSRAQGLRGLIELEAERGNEQRVAELAKDLQALSYRGPVWLIAGLVGQTFHHLWNRRFMDAQLLLAGVDASQLAPFQNRLRFAMLAVAAAGGGERADAARFLAAYESVPADAPDERGLFDRARGMADRHAVLANIIVGRNAVAQRLLRGMRVRRPDLDRYDALLQALLGRDTETIQTAYRELRLAGLAGIALLVESVAHGLAARDVPDEALVLTPVEQQVLRAMALGLSNKSIADEQRRTINTVRTHVSAVLRKLGATSRGEAVAAARRLELV